MAADNYLFEKPAGHVKVMLKPVNESVVLRERLVAVRLDTLSEGNEETVTLNLFEDVQLTAHQDRLETSASGGYAWIGSHDEMAGGVTLVVDGQKLAGIISLPNVTYHVRHIEDAIHVIREIDVTLRTSRNLPIVRDDSSSLEGEVLDLVNLEREVFNLHDLRSDNRLVDAARGHSEDMALQNYFDHTSLDGTTFSQRIKNAGYPCGWCGENIAAGYTSPQAVVNAWMNSNGHRANILRSSFCDLGVGYFYYPTNKYRHYWTQDFGRERNLNSCPVDIQPPDPPTKLGIDHPS
jgi:uncharacterized protein YkwD